MRALRLIWVLVLFRQVAAQDLSKYQYDPTLIFRTPPGIFVWSNTLDEAYPYDLLSNDEYGEYILGAIQFEPLIELYLVLYDTTTVGLDVDTTEPAHITLQKHNLGKEYIWRFFNQTGVLPSLEFLNTTTRETDTFKTRVGDFISFRLVNMNPYRRTNLSVPASDVVIEVPVNSRSLRTRRTFIELATWGLTRWKLSNAKLVTWDQIRNESSFVSNQDGKFFPSPEFFRVIHNPCVLDMFAFYIITSDVNNSQSNQSIGIDRVYVNLPMVKSDQWINLTSSFCRITNDTNRNPVGTEDTVVDTECGIIKQILLTNDHLLCLTSKGMYVSNRLSSSDSRLEDAYLQKPLLNYRLVDPCADLRDVLSCFDDNTGKLTEVTVRNIRMHYNPVCHLFQHPNYRDTVILVMEHYAIGEYTRSSSVGSQRGPARSFTVLYSDEPYNQWQIFLKDITEYNSATVVGIPGIFYNHELNHFDFVITTRPHGTSTFVSSRVILPRPKTTLSFYSKISTTPERGYQRFDFPAPFVVEKLQVLPGSMDVFFYGSQLWIAESAGFYVYEAVGDLRISNIDYCSFSHPDRFYVCVNTGKNLLFLGRVGSFYHPAAVEPHMIDDIMKVAFANRWILPINTTLDNTTQSVYQVLNNARMLEQLRNSYFSISYGGNLLMWYMQDYELLDTNTSTPLPGWDPILMPDNYTTSADPIIKSYLNQTVLPAAPITARVRQIMPRIEISPDKLPVVTDKRDGPLVAIPLDATSCMLFEAVVDNTPVTQATYFNRVLVGENIRCYIPAPIQTYVVTSLPMQPFHCKTRISFVMDNILNLVFDNSTCWKDEYVGWTLFIPGQFSVLIQGPSLSLIPNVYDGLATKKLATRENLTVEPFGAFLIDMSTPLYKKVRLYLLTEAQQIAALSMTSKNIATTSAPSMNTTTTTMAPMSTTTTKSPESISTMDSANISTSESPTTTTTEPSTTDQPTTTPTPIIIQSISTEEIPDSWRLQIGNDCNFDLQLVSNPILKSSGGRVSLDLQDTLSFTVRILALNEKAQVMMQRPLLSVTNSNPYVLSVDRNNQLRRTLQNLLVSVKPTGLGLGISTVTVRSLACSNRCRNPCSHTFVFQMLRSEGRSLRVHYPVAVSNKALLNPDKDGNVRGADGRVIYTRLPVNYRPPSIRGRDIPLSRNIYHSDPSEPKYKNYYRISNETGVFGKCINSANRADCNCSDADRISEHPQFTDCKEMVYLVRRAKEIKMRATYAPLMNASDQLGIFFLPKTQLSVYVEEVNGRADYTIKSREDDYLREINSDKELNLGRRFYDANDITIACYGTGLFHFQVQLGEFDSFDQVTGHFILFSEEPGIHSVTYMMVMFLTLSMCLLCLFAAFLHIQKRLLIHLPLRGETEKIKSE